MEHVVEHAVEHAVEHVVEHAIEHAMELAMGFAKDAEKSHEMDLAMGQQELEASSTKKKKQLENRPKAKGKNITCGSEYES